jgi:hypothetical protein
MIKPICSTGMITACAAVLLVPALAEPRTHQGASPAVEQAVKMIMDSRSGHSMKDFVDPSERHVVPAKFKPAPHKHLDGLLIMGGPEAFPM